MEREEAKNLIHMHVGQGIAKAMNLVDKIYDDFERKIELLKATPNTCDRCKHQPLQGENYYDPCGECKRFYIDHYDPKDTL